LARSEDTKSIALSIGAALTAGGFGFHFRKGYIYAAMVFSGAVEGLGCAVAGGSGGS
jgi:predicted tellurium resistance membrane protein TerC